jgi:hypothetical protein
VVLGRQPNTLRLSVDCIRQFIVGCVGGGGGAGVAGNVNVGGNTNIAGIWA